MHLCMAFNVVNGCMLCVVITHTVLCGNTVSDHTHNRTVCIFFALNCENTPVVGAECPTVVLC